MTLPTTPPLARFRTLEADELEGGARLPDSATRSHGLKRSSLRRRKHPAIAFQVAAASPTVSGIRCRWSGIGREFRRGRVLCCARFPGADEPPWGIVVAMATADAQTGGSGWRSKPGVWIVLAIIWLVLVLVVVNQIDDGATTKLQRPGSQFQGDEFRASVALVVDSIAVVLFFVTFRLAASWLKRSRITSTKGLGSRIERMQALTIVAFLYALADLTENTLTWTFVHTTSTHNKPLLIWLWSVALLKLLLLAAAVLGLGFAARKPKYRQPRDVREPKRPEPDIGIALSGGGIRSAAYAMGAMQGLLKELPDDTKARMTHISAVSGGSYTAAGRAILQTESSPDLTDGREPFSENSPEFNHLLRRTDYLAPGGRGKLQAFNRWLRGFLWNLIFLGLGIFVVARVTGWLVGWYFDQYLEQVSLRTGVTAVVVALLVASVPQMLRRPDDRRRSWFSAADVLVVIAVGLGFLFLIGSWDSIVRGLNEIWESVSEKLPRISEVAGTVTLIAVGTAVYRALRLPYVTRIANAIAGLIVPVTTIVIFLAVASAGLGGPSTDLSTISAWEWLVVLIAVALFAVLATRDAQMWSPHHFYKSRLANAFALKRTRDGVSELDSTDLQTYAELHHQERFPSPDLLICATANVSSNADLPSGSGAVSWVFQANGAGLSEWPDTPTAMLSADEMADRLGKRREDYTYGAAMAVSGAAISPAMGRLTRRSLQALMAVLNIRLGVWYPNPRRPATSSRRQPKVFPYLYKEIMGNHGLNDKFLYVTDGGHWDNLGLVELLRKRCKIIICFDGGGNRPGEYDSLSIALRTAQTQLGVTVEGLNPEKTMAVVDQRNVPEEGLSRVSSRVRKVPWRLIANDWQKGTIKYREENGEGLTGELWYCRLGLVEDAPFELLEYQRQNPPFPYHPTSQQLFASTRFEAYRQVGKFTAMDVVKSLEDKRRFRSDEPPGEPSVLSEL